MASKPTLRCWFGAATALVVAAWGGVAPAQVNVEPFREQLTDERFGARARASVASYAGNTRGVIFGSAGLLGVRRARHFAYLALSGDYTRLNGVVSVAKWFGHVRHDYHLSRVLWWEEYGQLESDRFRRVTVRELVGTGPRVGLVQSSTVQLFYGISYMYEHTNLDTEEGGGRGEGGAHRLSNYIAATFKVQQRIVLSSVTYCQPRLDAPSDVVVLSVSSADFTITPLLHSRLDATVRHDSVTPADVHATDVELKSAIELVF
jgi:hypothetical protein